MFGSKPISNRKTMDASLSPLGREKKKREMEEEREEMIVVGVCSADGVAQHGLRIGVD
jgi:hypothetical protein